MAVTFVFGSDPSGGTAALTVGTETTDATGVATFDDETPAAEGGDGLEINFANVAAFSDFTLVPRGQRADVGHRVRLDRVRHLAGRVALRRSELRALDDGDEYVVPGGQAGALLSASTFSTSESNINCAGYTEIRRVTWCGTSTRARLQFS